MTPTKPTTVRLTERDRENISLIIARGFAGDASGAIRVALAALAHGLTKTARRAK